MLMGRIGAAHVGVQRGNAVHQSLFQQEIEGAVHGRRRGLVAFGGQAVKNAVSTQRLMAFPHQLQHPAADIGQPHAALGAQVFGGVHGIVDAMLVGVRHKSVGFHGLVIPPINATI